MVCSNTEKYFKTITNLDERKNKSNKYNEIAGKSTRHNQ